MDWSSTESTGRFLPLEFYIFGISKENYTSWSPVESLCLIKMMSFTLSAWAGQNELLRESFRQRNPELAELVDDFAPFTIENLNEIVTKSLK